METEYETLGGLFLSFRSFCKLYFPCKHLFEGADHSDCCSILHPYARKSSNLRPNSGPQVVVGSQPLTSVHQLWDDYGHNYCMSHGCWIYLRLGCVISNREASGLGTRRC